MSITNDQLSVLQETDSVDWKCRTCTGTARPKRLSCILPEAEDDDNTDTEILTSSISNQILMDIRREVRETIRIEMQTSLQFLSDKIDDYELKIQSFLKQGKELENQCNDLRNVCKNLKIRNEALEQRLSTLEQNQLLDQVEICGVSEKDNENVQDVCKTICSSLKISPDSIIKAYRKKNYKKQGTTKTISSSTIIVQLRDGHRDNWLQSSKTTNLTGEHLGLSEKNKIFIRELLTPHTSFLLWKTKNSLKETGLYKYVWYKNGKILVRQTDNKKVFTIRCESDIEYLASKVPTME